jgi:mRNA deadenylase 3'-5' endonuclease subunit Ccr4
MIRSSRFILYTIVILSLQFTCTSVTAFTIVSWNVLAPVYTIPDKYRSSARKDLEWHVREPRIGKRLLDLDADIVCLQEVQLDLWPDMYVNHLSSTYDAIVQNVTMDHPVANVILLRHGFAEVVAVESRSRALIAVLRVNDGNVDNILFLTNVHLEARNKEETRIFQLRSLFKRLHHHIQRHSPTEPPCIILAGDFNMIDSHPVYHLLSKGCLPDSHALSIPTRAWLPLHNAYLIQPSGLAMTFRGGTVLDYVWISASLRVEATWRTHYEAQAAHGVVWPSRFVPSDHIPIGATLSFPLAPSVS